MGVELRGVAVEVLEMDVLCLKPGPWEDVSLASVLFSDSVSTSSSASSSGKLKRNWRFIKKLP
jgi:hypothetical protein